MSGRHTPSFSSATLGTVVVKSQCVRMWTKGSSDLWMSQWYAASLSHIPTLTYAQQVEAGQYCTFVVHRDGGISACGKGSYGRLGLGDSNNQASPKRLHLDARLRRVSSSKGSDGHTISLSTAGQVFTWGDGEWCHGPCCFRSWMVLGQVIFGHWAVCWGKLLQVIGVCFGSGCFRSLGCVLGQVISGYGTVHCFRALGIESGHQVMVSW